MWRPRPADRQGEEGITAFFQAVIPWQPQAGSQPLLWSFLSLALICQDLFESATPSYRHKTQKKKVQVCFLLNQWTEMAYSGSKRTDWREQRLHERSVLILGLCHLWSDGHILSKHRLQGVTQDGRSPRHWTHDIMHPNIAVPHMLLLQISCYIVLFSLKQKPKMGGEKGN